MNDDLRDRLAGRRRVQTGKRFEGSLTRIHEHYRARGIGKLLPHYPKTLQVGKRLVRAKGGAPVDFSGAVKVGDRSYAVAFDAKVLDRQAASYDHDRDQRHQLLELHDIARAGGLAFLLVEIPKHDYAVVLYGPELFVRMMAGDRVLVHRRGVPLWPHVPYAGLGYDWLAVMPSLLHHPVPILRRDATEKLLTREATT